MVKLYEGGSIDDWAESDVRHSHANEHHPEYGDPVKPRMPQHHWSKTTYRIAFLAFALHLPYLQGCITGLVTNEPGSATSEFEWLNEKWNEGQDEGNAVRDMLAKWAPR